MTDAKKALEDFNWLEGLIDLYPETTKAAPERIAEAVYNVRNALQTQQPTTKNPVNAELLGALKKCREELLTELAELGGCDHSVGMCCCPLKYAIEAADKAIANAERKD